MLCFEEFNIFMMPKKRNNTIKGKVVLITGAASGIGKAMVNAFLKEQCIVAAIDISDVNLQQIKNEVLPDEKHLYTYPCDIANEQQILQTLETISYEIGSIQIVINNAGILDDFIPVHALSNHLWEHVLRVNLFAAFIFCRELIPEMRKRLFGVIINVSSVGGLHGVRAGAAYTTSKHALIGLTKNIAYTYALEGIRCNVIAPGAVKTSISNQMKPDVFGYERSATGFPLIPRVGEPSEVASIAVFLSKPEASLINGGVVVADAGWTAY
jgi:NAD(P)-dependent dehydrogenase (short-subunit alcohol dehydrogenase family)